MQARVTVSVVVILAFAAAQSGYAQVADSSAVVDSLALQLERELAAMEQVAPPRSNVSRAVQNSNPAISLIGDVRASVQSDADRNVDAELREAEMALKSVVDPYVRGDVFIAAHHEGGGEFAIELEEAFITTLSLPGQLQGKAGKFRSEFGKINRTHPHALPHPDIPAMYVNYFGEEGLNDQGVSLSWLLPNPHFFQDFTLQVTRGPGESESFAEHGGNRLLYVGHLKNFWDLSDNATLEVGLSGAIGPNSDGRTTALGGVDVTYKWKPVQFNRYQSITLQGEAIFSRREGNGLPDVDTFGMYALASVQLAQRWFVVGRFDHSDVPDDHTWNEEAFALTLGWYATEYQKIEFGMKTVLTPETDRTYGLTVRSIFVMGTHGAHEY